MTLPTRWCLHTNSWILKKYSLQSRFILLGLSPSRSGSSSLFFDQGWFRTVHLTTPQGGGSCTGSMMVPRATVLGMVCLCPEVQLSCEPPADATQLIACFPRVIWAQICRSAFTAWGIGKCPIAWTVFLSGVFCISLLCFGVGEPHIWLKTWEEKGKKRPFVLF